MRVVARTITSKVKNQSFGKFFLHSAAARHSPIENLKKYMLLLAFLQAGAAGSLNCTFFGFLPTVNILLHATTYLKKKEKYTPYTDKLKRLLTSIVYNILHFDEI